MRAEISIIVAIYNIEPYLTACVDSLLKTDAHNCEVLLIDDGSTDSSGAICDKFAQQNDNVTAYHKPNGGLSDARNYGLDRSNGDWIIFIDGDDCLDRGKFNQFLNILRGADSSVDVVFNDYILNNLRTGKQLESQQISSSATINSVLSAPGAIWNVWRFAYRKSFLEKNKLDFKVGWLAEDLDFTTRVFVQPNLKIKFAHIPYYLYAYHRGGSITETASLRLMECMTTSVREHYQALKNRNDTIAKLLKRKLLSDYIKHAAKYFDFDKTDRKKIRRFYRVNGSPLPFNAVWLAGVLLLMRRIYHIRR
ncbi:MAG: glycosyltransferase [Clostridiales bacterium]|jgi:glycosyltransferase involved in cell wall biosynthesis|nr:glycosyltransferase [Clostridiales bacterium]